MGRQKLSNNNIRKLHKGTSSYSITLPIEAIRDLKWRKSQKLVVDVDVKRQRIVIKDWVSN